MKLDYSKSWILQKLTASVFLLFLIYLVFSLKNINLSKHDELLIIYFFSLIAKAEAVDPPPKTGSDIEIGSGFVFSI